MSDLTIDRHIHIGRDLEDKSMDPSYIRERTGLTAGEKVASLFQPDALLSAQYFDDRRIKTSPEPEKRLMLAIMEDAIDCFRDNHSAQCGKSKQLFDEAHEWIFGPNDWFFGFENVCSALGFNPEYIRQGLTRWKKKQSNPRGGFLWERTKTASLTAGIDSRAGLPATPFRFIS